MAGALAHRAIETNDIQMHLVEAGQGPLVLLLHGFPEGWYSWRHQLDALSSAGHPAAASILGGYGGTHAGHVLACYRRADNVAEPVGVLDALRERTTVAGGSAAGAVL